MNFLLCAVIFSGLFLASNLSHNAFADHTEEDSNIPKWKLFFITGEHRCLTPQEKSTLELTSIAKQYMTEYEFENIHLESRCMYFEDYSKSGIPHDLSLVILVLDGHVADSILTKNQYESLYSHLGDDKSIKHTIIIKTNSINDHYTSTPTPWLLSHQLSHYVLSYKGYNGNSIEYLLHDKKMNHLDCIGKSNINSGCSKIKTIMRADDLGKDYFVMPPYQPVVGKSSIKHLPDELLSSKITIELQREITKWWTEGKINDSDYTNTILHILNSPTVLNSTVNEHVMSLPNGFAILDKTQGSNHEWTPGPFNAFASSNDVSEIFSLIPFEAEELSSEVQEYPKWFKIRAQLWSEEKIPDKIFFDGLEALLRVGIIQQ